VDPVGTSGGCPILDQLRQDQHRLSRTFYPSPLGFFLHILLFSPTLESGCRLSTLAVDRLAVKGVCKLHNCRQTFTSAEAHSYRSHLRDFHDVRPGKHGQELLPCPWEGCKQSKSRGSLFNHVLGHSMKVACGVCDEVMSSRSDLVKKHYKTQHKQIHPITSRNFTQYAYLYFQSEEVLIN
jgi:hypothetical protein